MRIVRTGSHAHDRDNPECAPKFTADPRILSIYRKNPQSVRSLSPNLQIQKPIHPLVWVKPLGCEVLCQHVRILTNRSSYITERY